jgi:hypothetical protein
MADRMVKILPPSFLRNSAENRQDLKMGYIMHLDVVRSV